MGGIPVELFVHVTGQGIVGSCINVPWGAIPTCPVLGRPDLRIWPGGTMHLDQSRAPYLTERPCAHKQLLSLNKYFSHLLLLAPVTFQPCSGESRIFEGRLIFLCLCLSLNPIGYRIKIDSDMYLL